MCPGARPISKDPTDRALRQAHIDDSQAALVGDKIGIRAVHVYNEAGKLISPTTCGEVEDPNVRNHQARTAGEVRVTLADVTRRSRPVGPSPDKLQAALRKTPATRPPRPQSRRHSPPDDCGSCPASFSRLVLSTNVGFADRLVITDRSWIRSKGVQGETGGEKAAEVDCDRWHQ